jgi:hypothetical protein
MGRIRSPCWDCELPQRSRAPGAWSVATRIRRPPRGRASRRMEEHRIVPGASSLARALCRPLPRREFDRGSMAAAARP